MRRARQLIAKREAARALEIGEQLLEMGFSGGFEVLALAHDSSGATGEAIKALERGVEQVPSVWTLWQLLGNLLDRANRPTEALDAYERAAGCAGADLTSIEYNRALALLRLDRHADALVAVKRVLDAAPDDILRPLAISAMVDALLALGRAKEATSFAQAEVERAGSPRARAWSLAELGWARFKGESDRAGAERALEELVELGGHGQRWLDLMRSLEARPLEAGREFRLVLEGRDRSLGKDGEGVGFFVGMRVIAENEQVALELAGRALPTSAREGLKIDETEDLGPADRGALAGVCWYPGGRTFFQAGNG